MEEATGPPPHEFLLTQDNLAVLEAFFPDNDFVNLLKDINMVLDYETKDLPAPVPSLHNEILSEFRSRELGELPGALASALERSESARRVNLDRLNKIRGARVQYNLNLGHMPRLFVRLSALFERFLALSESDSQHVEPYREGVKDLIKAQQQALTGALFILDRMVRLYGRHEPHP